MSAIPHAALLALLGILTILLLTASIAVGYAPLNIMQAAQGWLRGDMSLPALVLTELRIPRAVLGLTIGFTLGLTGSALQGFLRNPLADPGVIGVSAMAALGSVIVFYSGLAGAFLLALPLGGIAGAATAVILLYALAGRDGATTTLILAGVAISAFAGALTSLALNLSPSPYAAMEIMFWLMGSLAERSLLHLELAVPLMFLGWCLVLSTAKGLDALVLGEDTALSLGINIPCLRMRLVAGTALSVGSAVAVAGAVGFVGLIVPHLLRPLTGYRPGRLLLASGLGGASLTMAADIAIRLLDTRPELKLGVVTALIGAPFLFGLIYRLRREGK